ncbi:MAG: ribosome small subunit-dependent GTPase A [Candidatus Izemoplasmatales bacterium]|nr:ribosome small subunit-dependent GTPase A [Candidatus Izemoplasmatales bacterium]
MNIEKSSTIGRVVAVYRERYLVETNNIIRFMEVSGHFRHLNHLKNSFPQVGDYVNFHLANEDSGIIDAVQNRRSILERTDAGAIGERQILAANIDLVFICLSVNQDFHPKKLRNYLNLTYGGVFETIVLLTKKDLCPDPQMYVNQVRSITDEPFLVVSAYDQEDMMKIQNLVKNKTAVLIGSSGVGKSTIINDLLKEERFATNTIRLADAQGRHTTVNRELVHLPEGGSIIDTPGLRLVYAYEVDPAGFLDIETLSEGCLYRNCTHTVEPGCLVLQGIAEGVIDKSRLDQYQRAMKQSEYNRRREEERNRLTKRRQLKR